MAAVARLASSNSDPVAYALSSLFSLLEPAPERLADMSSPLPPASSFYVPSLPTLPYPLNQHPTHPLNVWAGLLDSDPGEKDGGGEGAVGRESKIL